MSISADFLGQSLQNEKKIFQAAPVADFAGGLHPEIGVSTATINQESVAFGGKISPFGRLLITANILIRVNEAGLHYKPAPLIGVSYTF